MIMLKDRKVLPLDTNVIAFYRIFVDLYYNRLLEETIFNLKTNILSMNTELFIFKVINYII